MKIASGVVMVLVISTALRGPTLLARQNASDTPDAHVAIAKAAAGDTYQNLFNFLCTAPAPRGGGSRAGAVPHSGAPPGGGPRAGGPQSGGRGPAIPARSTWYAEPVKVFDNLYFVGQSEYSAWAVATSAGIILIDTLFDYSVEAEVADGLRKLGLDPATIRYAVVTHPHPDHHGGAKFLQDSYRTRVVMSAADWDVIDRLNGTKPARDLIATDGQRLTLGDTTLTLYVTPGHTPGTLSLILPVRENGMTHTVAYWGGNGLNADRESLQAYVQSARRFAEIARQAGTDVLMSNHTDWDGSKVYLPQLTARTPDRANPYIVGTGGVRNYLVVAEQCATARLLRLN